MGTPILASNRVVHLQPPMLAMRLSPLAVMDSNGIL
jgi:hypothetical protein